MKNPYIKVFITKSNQFRARIKESDESPTFEVTIGGNSWNNGKGKEYEQQIKRKCQLLMCALHDKLSSFNS